MILNFLYRWSSLLMFNLLVLVAQAESLDDSNHKLRRITDVTCMPDELKYPKKEKRYALLHFRVYQNHYAHCPISIRTKGLSCIGIKGHLLNANITKSTRHELTFDIVEKLYGGLKDRAIYLDDEKTIKAFEQGESYTIKGYQGGYNLLEQIQPFPVLDVDQENNMVKVVVAAGQPNTTDRRIDQVYMYIQAYIDKTHSNSLLGFDQLRDVKFGFVATPDQGKTLIYLEDGMEEIFEDMDYTEKHLHNYADRMTCVSHINKKETLLTNSKLKFDPAYAMSKLYNNERHWPIFPIYEIEDPFVVPSLPQEETPVIAANDKPTTDIHAAPSAATPKLAQIEKKPTDQYVTKKYQAETSTPRVIAATSGQNASKPRPKPEPKNDTLISHAKTNTTVKTETFIYNCNYNDKNYFYYLNLKYIIRNSPNIGDAVEIEFKVNPKKQAEKFVVSRRFQNQHDGQPQSITEKFKLPDIKLSDDGYEYEFKNQTLNFRKPSEHFELSGTFLDNGQTILLEFYSNKINAKGLRFTCKDPTA